MRVHQHSTSNMLLGAPKDMKNCDTVPATMYIEEDASVRILTYWRPSQAEIDKLVAGQSVCLHVYGKFHPPVAISVEEP